MAEFSLRVDLSHLMAANRASINAAVFPLLNQAVRAVGAATQANWMEAVYRAKLWSGEKDAYAGSIQMKMTGDFSALVWTDYKLAEEIESGRPAKDLKDMLNTSMKVRLSKKGLRYLIIPFRHNTPGNTAHAPAMPLAIAKLAGGLALSSVTGVGRRVSGTGAIDLKTRKPVTVRQRRYNWGDKLVGAIAAGGTKHHEGMYRFDAKTPGGGRHSVFLTFRTMVEGSPGWIIGPRPGQHIAQHVVEDMTPKAEAAFQEALKRIGG